MSTEPRILKDLDDEGVLLVTLNRPRRKNAFDEAQWDGLADTVGLMPCEDPQGKHMTFGEWYMEWVDKVRRFAAGDEVRW